MRPVKLFISHASEDKEDFVEPLALALQDAGFEVWYDKFALTIGDSLLKKISEGLNQSDFGVVILSKYFFSKKWPQAELDGLFSLETLERKVILPIWKDVNEADVMAISPILAGKLAAMADHGVAAVVESIKRAVETARTVEKFSAVENALSRFHSLDQRVSGSRYAEQLASSNDGVKIVREAVNSAIATVKSELEKLTQSSKSLKFKIESNKDANELSIRCPFQIKLRVHYFQEYTNSLTNAVLGCSLLNAKSEPIEDSSQGNVVRKYRFRPSFDHTLKLIWSDNAKLLTTEQLVAFVLNELADEIANRQAVAEANMSP